MKNAYWKHLAHYYLHEKGTACLMSEIMKLNTADAMRTCEAPCKSI
jgi:hypothetical protein